MEQKILENLAAAVKTNLLKPMHDSLKTEFQQKKTELDTILEKIITKQNSVLEAQSQDKKDLSEVLSSIVVNLQEITQKLNCLDSRVSDLLAEQKQWYEAIGSISWDEPEENVTSAAKE